jgi:hypothetical protein
MRPADTDSDIDGRDGRRASDMSTEVRTTGQDAGQDTRHGAPPAGSARRPIRPGRQSRPGRPAAPGRPPSPIRPAGPGRPGRPLRGPGPGHQESLRQQTSAATSTVSAGGPGTAGSGTAGWSTGGSTTGRSATGRSATVGSATGDTATGAMRRLAAQSAQARHRGRMPFVLLVLGLLGGGLICLLVVNTTLAAASISISRLQQQNAAKLQRVQQVRRLVASEKSAAVIEKEAAHLGMRPEQVPVFIDLRTRQLAGSR